MLLSRLALVLFSPLPEARLAHRARVCAAVDYQSDYGRGEQHLSAELLDGDLVVYKTGTWEVDSVDVGDGTPTRMRLAWVDHTQIVWTHNSEHGVVRARHAAIRPGGTRLVITDEDIEFGPEQLHARLGGSVDSDIASAELDEPLPDEIASILHASCALAPPAPPASPPAPRARAPPGPSRARPPHAQLLSGGFGRDYTDENVRAVLDEFMAAAPSMFGCHEEARSVGITGDVGLVELDGPVVVLTLRGRFWHRRDTVLRNAAAYLMNEMPEISSCEIGDPDELLDLVYDEETGQLVEDRRSPDFNGDRATLEYQGIDPDERGPFAKPSGGFRPGGSIFS